MGDETNEKELPFFCLIFKLCGADAVGDSNGKGLGEPKLREVLKERHGVDIFQAQLLFLSLAT